MVHRLVAEAFIPNENNLFIINHKDGNRENNRTDNLEWCDNSHNVREAYRLGLNKPITGKEHNLSVRVNQFDLKGNLIKSWDCMRDIQRELGFAYTNISRCCRNKQKTAYGFIWKYIDGDSKKMQFENNFISKEKIREKIEELEKQKREYEESDMEQDEDYYFDMNAYDGKLDVLKELLGEEK